MAERYIQMCICIGMMRGLGRDIQETDNSFAARTGMERTVEHTEVAFEGIVCEGARVRLPIGLGWNLEMYFYGDVPAMALVADDEIRGATGRHDDDADIRVLSMASGHNQYYETTQDDEETLDCHVSDSEAGEESFVVPSGATALTSFVDDDSEDAWMGVAGPDTAREHNYGFVRRAEWDVTGIEISGVGTWAGGDIQMPIDIDIGETT
ncbi:hypothetical protein FB567DRAFT_553451 [Paraphoma chrysanthemicola]|uniref:Uncharacterized protein n=1 Tax=Paraphoma chrysanthemicola TaxID=798071 RepID=A0A8K0VTV5_9PLEO|nr:hypothetical protein FB567DRAFT_553451 [Paraphoma chrysanthemicola]